MKNRYSHACRLLLVALVFSCVCTRTVVSAYAEDEKKPLTGITIGIDPGHQSKGDNTPEKVAPGSTETKPKVSSGTRGVVTGIPEYQVNLDVALILKQKLEELGATVIMSREENDVNISNAERAELMNQALVDLCIRIHCNGSTSSSAKGALIMVPKGKYTETINEQSLAAGEIILSCFLDETGAKNAGIIYTADLTGFNWSTVPVCLIEMGFMTNPEEDKLLADEEYQIKCAQGITNGVLEWVLGL